MRHFFKHSRKEKQKSEENKTIEKIDSSIKKIDDIQEGQQENTDVTTTHDDVNKVQIRLTLTSSSTSSSSSSSGLPPIGSPPGIRFPPSSLQSCGEKTTSLSTEEELKDLPPYLAQFAEGNTESGKTLSRKEKRKSLFAPLFSRNLFGEPDSPRKSGASGNGKSVPSSGSSTPKTSNLLTSSSSSSSFPKEETKEKKRRHLSRNVSLNTISENKEHSNLGSPKMASSFKEEGLADRKHFKKNPKKKSAELMAKESILTYENAQEKPHHMSPPTTSLAASSASSTAPNQKAPQTFGRKGRKKIMSMQIKDSSIILAANNVTSWDQEVKTARGRRQFEIHSASHSREGSVQPKKNNLLHVSQENIFSEAKRDIFLLMSTCSFQNWKLKKISNNLSFSTSKNFTEKSSSKNENFLGEKKDDDDVTHDVITLDKVLSDPQLSKDFEIFLKAEFSAENIYFFREVERFESTVFENQLDIDREALRIYEKYLAPGTDLQVNVSADVLGRVHMALFGEPLSRDEETDNSWMRWFVPTEYSPKAKAVASAAAAAASAKNVNVNGSSSSSSSSSSATGGFEDGGMIQSPSQLPPQIACLMTSSSQPSVVDLNTNDKHKKRRSIFFRKT